MLTKVELNQIVTRVKNLKELLAIPLGNWDRKTRPGMESKKRSAETELINLTKRYKAALRENALAIVVTGSGGDRFAEIAQKEVGCYTVDANILYQTLAKRLEGIGKEFSASHVSRIAEELRDIGVQLQEAGLVVGNSLPFPKAINLGAQINNFDNLVRLIRVSVEDGHTDFAEPINLLARSFLVNQVLDLAVRDLYSTFVLPVVITGATPEQITDLRGRLFDGKVFVVATGDADPAVMTDAIVERIGAKSVAGILKKAKNAKIPVQVLESETQTADVVETTNALNEENMSEEVTEASEELDQIEETEVQ